MKLIIDISEDLYKWIKDKYDNPNEEVAYSAIKNGIPCEDRPQGDLISREALKEDLKRYFTNGEALYQILTIIDNAPTVAVNCKDCDGYEAGYSAGLKDAERPIGEYKTACNVLLSLEQIVRSSDGWEDSAVEAVHNAIQTAIKALEIVDDVNHKVYRNENCPQKHKCYDYQGYHCAGCSWEKKGGAE